jgi:hypothetical protein
MLLRVVAVQTGVSVDRMKSRDRSRRVARARRIAVVAATRYLGRDQIEVAACVGISSSAASRLRSAAAHRVEIDEAAMLAVDELRRRS